LPLEKLTGKEFLNAALNMLILPGKITSSLTSLFRPAEVELLIGDPTKAQQKHGTNKNI